MIKVRLMRGAAADADVVRQVEAVAFGAWWRQWKGGSDDRPPRTRANILACREKEPEGCFVAEEDGQVVGSIFSRTWGGVGWFGNLVVLPEYQGRGISKRLIAASLEYLCQEPGRVIGLETMPESPYNLGLYLRQGFQARLPTLLLAKVLEQPIAQDPVLPCWSSADAEMQERWLSDLRGATGQIQPGLDYSKAVTSTARHGLGETLVLMDSTSAVGLSTVWLTSIREGWGEEQAGVQVLALHPAHTEEKSFRALLDASEALARAHGKRALTLSVNACHPWALQQLLKWGYRIERAMLRMVLKGTDEGPTTDNCVNLSRWAG